MTYRIENLTDFEDGYEERIIEFVERDPYQFDPKEDPADRIQMYRESKPRTGLAIGEKRLGLIKEGLHDALDLPPEDIVRLSKPTGRDVISRAQGMAEAIGEDTGFIPSITCKDLLQIEEAESLLKLKPSDETLKVHRDAHWSALRRKLDMRASDHATDVARRMVDGK